MVMTKNIFSFMCRCLVLFILLSWTSDFDSASGPWLWFVSAMAMVWFVNAMVRVCKCHGYGLQVPWLRFASAMVTVANSHYNKKKAVWNGLFPDSLLAFIALRQCLLLSCGKH